MVAEISCKTKKQRIEHPLVQFLLVSVCGSHWLLHVRISSDSGTEWRVASRNVFPAVRCSSATLPAYWDRSYLSTTHYVILPLKCKHLLLLERVFKDIITYILLTTSSAAFLRQMSVWPSAPTTCSEDSQDENLFRIYYA